MRAATVVAVLAALLPMSVARAQADAEPASAPATSPEVDLVVTMHDGGGHVLRLDSESGRLLAEIDADPDTAAGADGVVVGPDGLLYVSGHGSDSVERYDPVDNSHVDTFVASGAAGLDAPRGLAFGPGGDLYVVSGNTARCSDSTVRVEPPPARWSTASCARRGLVVGGDGDIYVADAGEDTIERFEPTGLPLGTFARLDPGRNRRLAWDSDGNLLVTTSQPDVSNATTAATAGCSTSSPTNSSPRAASSRSATRCGSPTTGPTRSSPSTLRTTRAPRPDHAGGAGRAAGAGAGTVRCSPHRRRRPRPRPLRRSPQRRRRPAKDERRRRTRRSSSR